jgi:hypothetical protein
MRGLVQALGLAALCALQPAQAAWVYALGKDVHLSGKIEKGDALKIAERLGPDTRKLTLLSPGGHSAEAFEIARLVRTTGTLVVAGKYCISACAFIFSLAKKQAIDEGGFVAFHAGEIDWYADAMEALLQYQPHTEAFKKELSEKREALQSELVLRRTFTQQAFSAMGVDDTWFRQMNDLTAMTLIRFEMDETTRRMKSTVKPSRCDWWVPDSDGFAAIGIVLKQYQRPDKQAIAERLKKPVDRIYWGALSDLPPASSDSPCGPPTATP